MSKAKDRSLSVTSHDSYSAAIIADLVAEFPVPDGVNQESRRKSSSYKQSKTNLAYDSRMDPETGVPATFQLGSMETVQVGSTVVDSRKPKNASNTVTFGKELNIQTPAGKAQNHDENRRPEITSIVGGFKEMSPLRKMAFGASFLPSIMFVLCFAIILPCDKLPLTCVQEIWSINLNGTEITSQLNFANSITFSSSNGTQYNILCLDSRNGITLWRKSNAAKIQKLDCEKPYFSEGKNYCTALDDDGFLRFYNSTTGDNHLFSLPNIPTAPAVLSSCKDGFGEIAMLTSKDNVNVLHDGSILSSIRFSGCTTIPTQLTTWNVTNSTNLLFLCQNENDGVLMKLSLNCSEKISEEIIYSSNGSIEEAIFLPTSDGVALWLEDAIFMIHENNTKLWRVSTTNHSMNGRFLKYGRFSGKEFQLALFSADITDKLRITVLDPQKGNEIWQWSIENAEVHDVKLLSGEDKDLVIASIQKMKPDFTTEVVTQLNEVTTSIGNLLSTQEIETPFSIKSRKRTVNHEIALLQLDGKVPQYLLKEINSDNEENTAKNSRVEIAAQIEGDYLSVAVYNQQGSVADLMKIGVKNWDKFPSPVSRCRY